MKSILKKSLTILFAIIFLLILIFWSRIENSYTVYSIVNNVLNYINNGESNYNIVLDGVYATEKSTDRLNVAISYSDETHFSADVRFKQKEYIVKSKGDSTSVYIGPSDLIIDAKGSDKGNFDILQLFGEILDGYPQTKNLTKLSFFEKIGIAIWAGINCSSSEDVFEGKSYDIISIPIDSKEIHLWIAENSETNYLIKSEFDNNKIDLSLTLNSPLSLPHIPNSDSIKTISIDRKELNTAIYRGALRTGGLMLTRIEPPKTDNIERKYGNGKLIYKDGNRVIIAKGTHRELGKIEGSLLKDEIRKMIDATLYTMCWVYTSESKSWFIDDFRAAYKRLLPFIPDRYQEEMEGMAETSGIPLDEIKLTNVFPALFHCSGFAVYNSSSKDGILYHGRVLDYITELGLQFSSVVYILKPDGYNAFANVGFAGFIGSVTGMNEKQISFGEMGGGGEGDWDGMPMAFLMRDGLERANTLDEAVNIFSEAPRTCEYYYVLADGKIPDARGLETTPTLFDVIEPNTFREKLPHPVQDAIIMSSGDRYENLVKRIKDNFGEIDSEKAIRLMDRPVAMKSDLHNALFAPQTLEFWVANAGNNSPACNEPYTHYNLSELLELVD